jgi:hypothetical protein
VVHRVTNQKVAIVKDQHRCRAEKLRVGKGAVTMTWLVWATTCKRRYFPVGQLLREFDHADGVISRISDEEKHVPFNFAVGERDGIVEGRSETSNVLGAICEAWEAWMPNPSIWPSEIDKREKSVRRKPRIW